MFDDVTEFVRAQRNAAWGEMARRLAHEIKNPLTPVRLSAERVRHKCLAGMEDGSREILDRATSTIIDQVEAMKGMVDAFTQYARSPELKMKPLYLGELSEQLIDMYRDENRNIQIHLDRSDSELEVMADRDRLRQLLHNLLRNAIDALHESAGGEISLCVEKIDEESGYSMRFSIEDNGPGFDPDVLNNVFEPYMTTRDHGTGLGLAIVKKIVEEHNGTIQASNRWPSGARIEIVMPVYSG